MILRCFKEAKLKFEIHKFSIIINLDAASLDRLVAEYLPTNISKFSRSDF